MNFDFTSEELIFIYSHFKNELRKTEPLFNDLTPSRRPQDLAVLRSIVLKLEQSYPTLKALHR